jgi:hypothetical protein
VESRFTPPAAAGFQPDAACESFVPVAYPTTCPFDPSGSQSVCQGIVVTTSRAPF